MQINRDYYTINQLSKKWQLSTDDVVHLGLTDQIEFTALVDEKHPNGYIQRGMEFPISAAWLHNIYYGEAAFEVVSTLKESSVQFSPTTIDKRYPSILTFYPGISRLVVQSDEVKRFESTIANKKELSISERENLLRTIGSLTLLLIEKSDGKKFGTREKINRKPIYEAIQQILYDIKVSDNGQSKGTLDKLLNEAVKLTLED